MIQQQRQDLEDTYVARVKRSSEGRAHVMILSVERPIVIEEAEEMRFKRRRKKKTKTWVKMHYGCVGKGGKGGKSRHAKRRFK